MSTEHTIENSDLPTINILLVEDEFLTATDILGTLERLGYLQVKRVSSGEEALAYLAANSAMPDLILMDIQLKTLPGGMDGISTTNQIRKKWEEEAPAVIYLTSLKDRNVVKRAMRTLPEAFLHKPIRDLDLDSAMELALYRKSKDEKADPHSEEKNHVEHDFFFVRTEEGLVKIKAEQVLWLTGSRGKNCEIRLESGRHLVNVSMAQTLKKIQLLPSGPDFIKISQKEAVNFQKVDRITGSQIVIGAQKLQIDRAKLPALKKRFLTL